MKINFLMVLAILQILIITACNSEGEQRNSATIDTTKVVQIQPETFYNFIYDFMFKEEIQAERAKVQGWKFKNYFEGYDYTTHFFNSFEIPDNEFNSDISAKKYLSAINLNSRTKEVFAFEKSGDKWFLTNYSSYEFNTDSVIDFETFLFHFSKDSAYRMEHIQFPLKHGALNDEEDYSDTIIYLTRENVPDYDFFNNSEILFFHDANYLKADKVLIYLRGIDNGINTFYYFKKLDNIWYLVEDDDFST